MMHKTAMSTGRDATPAAHGAAKPAQKRDQECAAATHRETIETTARFNDTVQLYQRFMSRDA